MSNTIIYNGQAYGEPTVNNPGVGEFTSNGGQKSPTGSNKKIFNDYVNNVASGDYSHAEGWHTNATGGYSHAEGQYTLASGQNSHAEGQSCTASGHNSHAEGNSNSVSGLSSHAEGYSNSVTGSSAHAEGEGNIASADYTHVGGLGNRAVGQCQTVIGKLCQPDENMLFIIGNGSSDYDRSNALTLDWNGVLNAAGEVKTNGSTLAKDSSLAPAYSNSNTYYKDFYVTKGNTLYKSNVAISTAEDWDSTHWNSTTLGTELFGYIQGANGRFTSAENRITALENGGGGGGDVANPNISDAYDDTATYSEGDYCIYSNTLYKANTDISTAESWTAAHWTSTTVGEELLSLITRIEALETLADLDNQNF